LTKQNNKKKKKKKNKQTVVSVPRIKLMWEVSS